MSCPHGFTADDVARALGGEGVPEVDGDASRAHVSECESCLRAARAREAARTAWARGKVHGAAERSARAERLTTSWRSPSTPSRLVLATSAALGGLAVAAAMALLLPHDRASSGGAATIARARTMGAAHQRAPHVDTRAPALVAMVPCAVCTLDGEAVQAGDVVPEGARLDVPRGATLTLGFSLREGLVDPTSGVDLVGPTTIERGRVGEDGTPVVVVVEGTARVRARETPLTLASAHAWTRASDATWTLDVQATWSRVHAAYGEVALDADGARSTVHAGDSATVVAPVAPITAVAAPRHVPPASSAPTDTPLPVPLGLSTDRPPAGAALWRAGQEALRVGDRARAEVAFGALVRGGGDARLCARASFALAELELARGARAEAEAHLTPLVHDPDARLAEDAAFLLARARGEPSRRE